MKPYTLPIFLLSTAIAVSCSIRAVETDDTQSPLRSAVTAPRSRALTVPDDIKTLSLGVYENGFLTSRWAGDVGSDSWSITLDSLPTGFKTVYAFANLSCDEFPAKVTDIPVRIMTLDHIPLLDLTVAGVPMSGSTVINPDIPVSLSDLNLRRLMSRIVLSSVTFSGFASSLSLQMTGAVLVNVPYSVTATGTALSGSDDEFRMTASSGEIPLEGGMDYDGGADGLPASFYCFPNTQSCLKTKLSVKCSASGGRTYWYPMELPQLTAGYSYSVSLTVTGPGSPNPWTDVEKTSCNVICTVSAWKDGAAYEENF